MESCVCRYFLQAPGVQQGEEFEGLRPGVLSGELLDALGLKSTDPPPWLHRMRQLGYPPGYRWAGHVHAMY